MTVLVRQRPQWLLGGTTSLAALALALVDSQGALAGWLAALTFWISLPIGALGLVMMVNLIPGRWGRELQGPVGLTLPLLPPMALASLPVVLGAAWLYPWAAEDGFVYLTPIGFALRSIVILSLLSVFAVLFSRNARRPTALSAGGVMVLPLAVTVLSVDWLMSLDPSFNSSGFGLYVLSIQFCIALSVLIVLRLRSPVHDAGLLGALLLTAQLLWAYFAFTQYFIIWSGNLPDGVHWYDVRASGPWSIVEYCIAILGLLPAALLMIAPLRRNTRLVIWLAAGVLTGKWLELLWLVLPGIDVLVAFAAAMLATLGLGMIAAAWPAERELAAPDVRTPRPEIG